MGLQTFLHFAPVGNRFLSSLYELKRFPARKSPRDIIIGFVACLLKIGECSRETNNSLLKSFTFQAGLEFWREVSV